MVRVLLEAKANPNISIFDSGETPLHAASAVKNLDIILLLVQFGADINNIGNNGYNVLLIAAQEKRWDLIPGLLAIGANV